MTSMSDTDACEEFMTNLDVDENGDLDNPPGVEFYVHYQSLTSVSNLEYVNMLQPFGRGKWDATRDTGGGTGLYCYAYEAFEDDKPIPLPDDCHTVVIHTNAIPNELLVESEDEQFIMQETAKLCMYVACKLSKLEGHGMEYHTRQADAAARVILNVREVDL